MLQLETEIAVRFAIRLFFALFKKGYKVTMKHSIYSLLALGSLSLLAGCFFGSTPSKSTEGEATVKVFNVLSKELYDDAHIKGSQHLDFNAVKRQRRKKIGTKIVPSFSTVRISNVLQVMNLLAN